jgi:hypothetical protein
MIQKWRVEEDEKEQEDIQKEENIRDDKYKII